VYCALAYYQDHKEKIEASFPAEEKAEGEHEMNRGRVRPTS